jgi:uncharacterized cupredoxin-like copper-binding protein
MMQFAVLTGDYLRRHWLTGCLCTILGVMLSLGFFSTAAAVAAPEVTQVKVSLGNSANELKFFPNNLEFVVGQRYKLLLDNPSSQKHYFTAKAGKVEVKGAIHELELKPGGEAQWVFVPMKPGKYSLRCPIPGHTEAGMTGVITVSAQ